MTALIANLVILVLVLVIVRQHLRIAFYKGYFDQKQINQGKDPKQIIREIFPYWRFIF